MSETPSAPQGPDLAKGIPLASLPSGSMVAGHVGDDAVLLAREGEEIFALGATCSHYGGPLAEGLLEHGHVRCPWHHACFDLRTGDVVRAPALRPLPRWAVERRGDRVVVGAKIDPRDPELGGSPSPVATRVAKTPASIVIIGAGAAGSAAADTLRREGYAGPITLIDGDTDAPYDRPNLSKDYLAGNAPEEWIPLRSPDAYRAHGIELRRGLRAKAIDVAARRVALADGTSVAYERLLIATGATPARLPGPSGSDPRVRYLRTLADSRAIIAAAGRAKSVVVIGGSFIGLEVAAALRTRGLAVQVVAPEQRPLERVLGPELGDFVRRVHEEKGVAFQLGHTVESIAANTVTLDDGRTLPADLVVAGVGVRADLEVAATAGIVDGRGVPVSELLETRVPGIFAAGDIAYWPDPHSGERIHVEHWVVAQRQGQTAARNMLGAGERFTAAPFFWSAHYDVTVSYVGHAGRWDRIALEGDLAARDCTARYYLGERVLAVVTVGRDRASLDAELAMEGRVSS